MSEQPLFTQKHYEHLERALSEERAPREVVEMLCRVFEKDNPKFKPDVFRRLASRPQEGRDE